MVIEIINLAKVLFCQCAIHIKVLDSITAMITNQQFIKIAKGSTIRSRRKEYV